MEEPIIDDLELRQLMTHHLRRSLEDPSLRSSLPPELAEALRESPEQVVELLLNAMTQAATQRLQVDEQTQEQESALTPEEVQLVVATLFSLHESMHQPTDMDLDGALLFCNRGRKMLKSERYLDAKRVFEQAIQIKPIKGAWEGLAEAQEKLGQTEQAAESRLRAQQL